MAIDNLEWGPEQAESFSAMARRFRDSDDRAAVHLCAAVEIMLHDAEKADECRAFPVLLLTLILARRLGPEITHLLAHELLPDAQGVMQDLVAAVKHMAKTQELDALLRSDVPDA